MLLTATGLALVAAPGAAQVPTVPEQGSITPALPPPVRRGEPTIVRAADGSVTIRAVQLKEPLSLDGRLDELIYESVPSAGGFIQQDPLDGEAATEETELWIFFDDRNLYVSVRCWDSQPERMVASELRRDGNLNQGENVSVVLDTFHDQRNGFYFQTNPLGAMRDQEFTDEGNPNPDWDTVWEVRSGRFEHGWTLEMAIPFKSLRYAGAGPQVWGFNIRRFIAWKNERAFLTPIPRSYGNPGIYKILLAATLVGLEAPARSINLEAKPYVISSLTTDQTAVEPFANRTAGDVEFDIKYGLTPGLTADLTVNTDFAQVEADEQQVNLTRFSLSLPEKRDFFLEGRGIFAFGTGSAVGQGRGSSDLPVMFFSRQIGLSEGRAVPVRVGARLTGKAGLFTVGELNVQTGEAPGGGAPSTNFSVVWVKRAVLSRSSVGMIATRRTPSADESGSNVLWGLDGNFPFLTDWEITSYYARSSTPLRAGNDASYRVQVDYNGDRYGFKVGHLMVGESFNPEIGFMRRADFRLSSALARFSPPSVVSGLDSQAGLASRAGLFDR